MTVVLVHGNPETDAIWDPLVEALGRDDVVRLSPPGFGAPLPADFPATMTAYRDWLETQLEAIDGPVDLVGHDWGGGHVVNVVMHRPELVRSWASDAVGLFDADYVWHDLAQVWQTPGAGEELVAVTPNRVGGIGQADTVRVASVPGVLGRLHFPDRAVEVERRHGRALVRHHLSLIDFVGFRVKQRASRCRPWPGC